MPDADALTAQGAREAHEQAGPDGNVRRLFAGGAHGGTAALSSIMRVQPMVGAGTDGYAA